MCCLHYLIIVTAKHIIRTTFFQLMNNKEDSRPGRTEDQADKSGLNNAAVLFFGDVRRS